MSRLTANIIYNLIGRGLLLLLGFVSIKYIFSKLGEDALGIICFVLVMDALLCAVLEMGVCSTTVREVSAHFKSEKAYIQELIRTASLFYWCTYGLLGTAVYFLSPVLVEQWINLKTMDPETATSVLRVLGVASLLVLPKSLYASLFRGLHRMEINNLIDVFMSGLQQFGTILILAIGGGLFQVIYWLSGCYLLGIISYFAATAYFVSARSLIPAYFGTVVKRNLSFASRMMSVSMLATFHTQVDKLIISKLMPISLVGYYGVAFTSVSKGSLISNAIAQAAFPSFSSMSTSGNRKFLLAQYNKLQDFVCFGIVPIFAAIPFALIPLFSYMLNKEATGMLLLPTTLLCLGFYMSGTLNIPYVFSLAAGKPGIAARKNFYALFAVLPVTIILIYFYGLVGAGISWVYYNLFGYYYGVPRICRECLGTPTIKWYVHVARIFILVAISYGFGWSILAFWGQYTVLTLSQTHLLATSIFLIGSYFLIGSELRETIGYHVRMLGKYIISALCRLYP